MNKTNINTILKSIGAAVLLLIVSCTNSREEANKSMSGQKLNIEEYGKVNGQTVNIYNINFPGKLQAEVTNYGGIVMSLSIPDKSERLEDIVLGYDSLSSYLQKTPYFGSIIGRYAGRVANGRFTIDEKEFQLTVNNGPNHLHGGATGFDKVVWTAKATETDEHVIIILKRESPDGEEGYPGKLTTTVTYTFSENEFKIDYQANTNKPTIVNLTQHTYFNLSAGKENILAHELQLNANQFVPVNTASIPLGIYKAVANTPFDFREPKNIGQDINNKDQQLELGSGYDHSWVIEGTSGEKPRFAGSLFHKESGRYMECYTSSPGLHIYTANFFKGQFIGKNNMSYPHRYGVCFETQYFPDSPNQPTFPSPILRPAEIFNATTIFRFTTK